MEDVKVIRITACAVISAVMSMCDICITRKIRNRGEILCSRFRMHADQVKLVIRQPAVLRVDDRDDSVFTDIVKHRTLHGEINDIRAVFLNFRNRRTKCRADQKLWLIIENIF